MLQLQLAILTAWWSTRDAVLERFDDLTGDDRGDVTASTVLTVIIVVAALAAGGIIATKIVNNAKAIPDP